MGKPNCEFIKLRKRSLSNEDEAFGGHDTAVKVEVDLDGEGLPFDVSPVKVCQKHLFAFHSEIAP